MMKHFYTLLVTVLFAAQATAQQVEGTLINAGTESPVSNITVQLLTKDSASSSFFTVSNEKGQFTLRRVPAGNYILQFSSVNYKTRFVNAPVTEKGLNLGPVKLEESAEVLSEIVIDGAPPVIQKGDTTVYSASAFKVNPDANSEDLIKKMPGVTVDRAGNVTAQGETVRKVTVDGRDFFGDDATATLRNLPADVIDKIQVFDKLSDQAQLTGFDDGNTQKSINIVTKRDMRTGNFGRVFAGYGTDDRYAAGGNVSFFNNDRRISLLGLTNNVNQQNFSQQDLLGAMGGNRGGGRRRGGGDDFMVGGQSGIVKTNSGGINYNDKWGEKLEVSGSYFFNNSNRTNRESVNRQNFLGNDSLQFYDENSFSTNENYNHRMNVRINYEIDSNNSILINSGMSFQNNEAYDLVEGNMQDQKGRDLSNTNYTVNRKSWGNNMNHSIMYRRAFAKKGRSISANFSTSFSSNNGENYVNSFNEYFYNGGINDTINRFSDQDRQTNRYSLNLVYTEPLAPKTQLQVNYNPSIQISSADQQTFHFEDASQKHSRLDSTLSNVFDNTYNTHNAGITVRRGDRDNMISAGLSFQHSELSSDQEFPTPSLLSHTYSNLLGNVYARMKLSSKSHIRFGYRSNVNAPSVHQLQDVINTSNQLYYSTGNPDLDQQYSNSLFARFNYNNTVTNKSFFANLFVSKINNYITNATYTARQDSVLTKTVTLRRGSQISKPVNLDGHLNARSFMTYSMPLGFIKTNLNLNAGISYAKLPGLLNDQLNYSNAWNYNLGAALSSNVSEYVDFSLSYSANINNVTNTVRPNQNDNYFTQSAGFTLNLLSKRGTFFQNDISNQSYTGMSDDTYNQSYWLWNMAVGQKFLKDQKGELKLSVFDLLKQNKSISRDVTDAYIKDSRNDVLQQYFMLTFTYKLKTFGKGRQGNERERNRSFMPPYGRYGE